MSHFWVPIQVGPRGGARSEPLEALVDTGSTYTWVAREVLEALGVEPQRERPFLLADGRLVQYPMAWVQITLEGTEQPTIVVFAPTGSEPILGVVTLEEFGLAVDPVNERLISVPGLAKGAGLDEALITERLNLVYGSQPSETDEGLREIQRAVIARSEW